MKKPILLLLSLAITACGDSREVSSEISEEVATHTDPTTEPSTPELSMAELLAAMPQEPMPENPESLTRARSDGETVVVKTPPPVVKTPPPVAKDTPPVAKDTPPVAKNPAPTVEKEVSGGTPAVPPPTVSPTPAARVTSTKQDARSEGDSSMSVESAAVAKNVVDRQPSGSGPFVDGSNVWTWNRILKPGDQRRTIRHIYYREGTQVVAVPLAIKGASWRTWSRTAVHGAGSWRVDIVDEEGRVLKSLPFVVK